MSGRRGGRQAHGGYGGPGRHDGGRGGRGRGERGGGGRSGRGSGGRGRSGRGSGGNQRGAHSALNSVKTNIIPATVGANFSFYLYTGDCRDKNDNSIDGRGRRADLFRRGVWDTLLKDMPTAEKDALKRCVFFAGSFFFSGRPIPGLEQKNLPKLVVDGSETGGDTLTLVQVQHYAAPECLQIAKPNTEKGELLVETTRCATCTATFKNEDGLMQHCKQTGHELVYPAAEKVQPANPDVFLAYLNTALQRALGERLKKWGNEYIDEDAAIEKEKSEKQNHLGIKVYQAYSCKFGLIRNPVASGAKAKLILTVDLRAKIMRTVTVLDNLNRIQSTDTYWSKSEQDRGKRAWVGERVMYTRERRGYTVVGLDFYNSPSTLPVPGTSMNHDEYFKKKGILLKYPDHVPMVVVLGRQDREIYLPAELVTGTELESKTKEQLPMVASYTPVVRNEAIEKIRNKYLTPGEYKKKNAGPLLPALGVHLENSRMTVAAKVMSAPTLVAAGQTIPERFADNWAPQLAKAKFSVQPQQATLLKPVVFYAASIKKSDALAVYSRICSYVNDFSSAYRLSQKPVLVDAGNTDRSHIANMERFFATSQDHNQFCLDFVKPRQAADGAYPTLKKMLCASGHLSQFVSFKTYPHDNPRDARKSEMILRGCARQILQKAGVVLWWAAIPRSIPLPSVFVGVDVYHSPPAYDATKGRRVRKPSCAAIVVQLIRDSNPKTQQVEMFSQTFKQEGGQEFELKAAYQETLSTALKTFKVAPASCVCWRDGIVDGAHFTDEIQGLRKGLEQTVGGAGQAKKAEIAYITCQKRIDEKFLTPDGANSAPAGTMVSAIRGMEHQAFYLNGRAPPYSTSKPVRFVVIERDQGMMKVPVGELTYGQMHAYPNWTGPIKVPSCVQQAHKLAELAGGMPDSGDSIAHHRYANKVYFL